MNYEELFPEQPLTTFADFDQLQPEALVDLLTRYFNNPKARELIALAAPSRRAPGYIRGPRYEHLCQNYGFDYLGGGSESLVVADNQYNVAIAFKFQYVQPDLANRIFHNHRILNTLFPEHFPPFFAVISGYPGGSIRQIQKGVPACNNFSEALHVINSLHQKCLSAGLSLPLDTNADHLMLVNGEVCYLDEIDTLVSDPDFVREYMVNNGFTNPSIQKILDSLIYTTNYYDYGY